MIFHNYFVFELRISKLHILNISCEIDLLKFSYLFGVFCYEGAKFLTQRAQRFFAKYARNVFVEEEKGRKVISWISK